MEINKNREYAIYSEVPTAKESATIIYVLAETQKQAKGGKALEWKKGKASTVPWLEAAGMRKLWVG